MSVSLIVVLRGANAVGQLAPTPEPLTPKNYIFPVKGPIFSKCPLSDSRFA